MSVSVEYAAPVQQPIEKISAGTTECGYGGNLVTFVPVAVAADGGPGDILGVRVRPNRPGAGIRSSIPAHLLPSDARALAEALIEWADQVEG